jgi:hypothetical protein
MNDTLLSDDIGSVVDVSHRRQGISRGRLKLWKKRAVELEQERNELQGDVIRIGLNELNERLKLEQINAENERLRAAMREAMEQIAQGDEDEAYHVLYWAANPHPDGPMPCEDGACKFCDTRRLDRALAGGGTAYSAASGVSIAEAIVQTRGALADGEKK